MGVNDLRGSKSGSLKWGFKTAQNRAKRKKNAKIAHKARFSTGADTPTQAICWKMSYKEKFLPFSPVDREFSIFFGYGAEHGGFEARIGGGGLEAGLRAKVGV